MDKLTPSLHEPFLQHIVMMAGVFTPKEVGNGIKPYHCVRCAAAGLLRHTEKDGRGAYEVTDKGLRYWAEAEFLQAMIDNPDPVQPDHDMPLAALVQSQSSEGLATGGAIEPVIYGGLEGNESFIPVTDHVAVFQQAAIADQLQKNAEKLESNLDPHYLGAPSSVFNQHYQFGEHGEVKQLFLMQAELVNGAILASPADHKERKFKEVQKLADRAIRDVVHTADGVKLGRSRVHSKMWVLISETKDAAEQWICYAHFDQLKGAEVQGKPGTMALAAGYVSLQLAKDYYNYVQAKGQGF